MRLDFLKRIFSNRNQKELPEDLEQMVNLGILSEEERLRIEQHRITEKLEKLALENKKRT